MHCYGGRSRSAALVAAFLMSSLGWSYSHALSVIQANRPVASINAGFEAQLKAYVHAKYDVYVAQQVLLRGRVKALQSYRAISGSTEDELAVKESERRKFGGAKASSSGSRNRGASDRSQPGSKRSWGCAKDGEDDDTQNDEEDEMLCEHIVSQHIRQQSVPAGCKNGSDEAAAVSSFTQETSDLRKQIPLMDPRTPRLRLSRPGSSAVRVIPPLRGLERVFCCSWCQHNLFNLASVIRADIDVLPLPDLLNMDAGDKSTSGDVSFRLGPGNAGCKDPNSFLMPAPSPRGSVNGQSHASTSFSADAKRGGGGGYMYKEPPKTTRGAASKTFSFDMDSPGTTPTSHDGGSKSFDFHISSDSRDVKESSPGNSTDAHDDMMYSEDIPLTSGPPINVPKSRFHLDISQTLDDGTSSSGGSGRSRPPSGSGSANVPRMNFPPRLSGSAGPSTHSPLESPRITFPPRAARDSFTYPSPRDRPPSAEKRRWLARVNLLRSDAASGDIYSGSDGLSGQSSSKSKSEMKVAKLSNDDDEAIKLGFGRDKYIHLEYLEWMGEDVLSQAIDEGELKCGYCKRVIGMWTWNPSDRYLIILLPRSMPPSCPSNYAIF